MKVLTPPTLHVLFAIRTFMPGRLEQVRQRQSGQPDPQRLLAMADYIFELLTEEIPAWMHETAAKTLRERLARIASDLGATDPDTNIVINTTPRRILFLLSGLPLREEDKVLMLYQSANRDEAVFDEPDRFRIDRDPNPHLGFGIGTHLCLGASLAKAEIGIVFEELFRRLPDNRVPDDAGPKRGDSSLVLAIDSLPAVFTPS